MIFDKFIELVGDDTLYSPVHNCSPLFFGSLFNTSKYYDGKFDVRMDLHLLITIDETDGIAYYPADPYTRVSQWFFREYLKNPSILEDRKSVFLDQEKQIEMLYEQYSYEHIRDCPEDKLQLLCQQIIDSLWDANANVWFCTYFDEKICREVLESNGQSIRDEKFLSIWDASTVLLGSSFDTVRKQQLLELLTHCSSDAIAERCQYHYTTYHSARSLEYIKNDIKRRYGPQEKIEQLKQDLARCEKLQHKSLQAFNTTYRTATTVERNVMDYVQTCVGLRDRRKNFFAKGLTLVWRIVQQFIIGTDILEKHIPYLHIREIVDGPQRIKELQEDILNRSNGFALLVPYEGDLHTVTLHDGVGLLQKQIEKRFYSLNQTKYVKGQVAMEGVVTGTVKIVHTIDDLSKIEKGDIMVTGMTRPEFVHVLSQVHGIVTDEGGVTCHAAIISRELQIPCIVGTLCATQVFSDGDTIQLDGRTGVIRNCGS